MQGWQKRIRNAQTQLLNKLNSSPLPVVVEYLPGLLSFSRTFTYGTVRGALYGAPSSGEAGRQPGRGINVDLLKKIGLKSGVFEFLLLFVARNQGGIICGTFRDFPQTRGSASRNTIGGSQSIWPNASNGESWCRKGQGNLNTILFEYSKVFVFVKSLTK